ncbi:MAG TPA: lysophospholipid acyltransferase family protein [Candidatus Binatia bacterium]|nr:lysophospholipid acyltransferase family protein [Candidatus Binatia bacterium]
MFYIAQLCVLLVVTVLLAVIIIAFGPFDRDGKRVYWINQFWTWLVLRMGRISLNVKGLENLESGRQYVFMVNHQSNIDIPILIQSLLQFQLRWIAKKELLWVPLFGWAMWASRHITVDRSDPLDAIKSLERAKRRIAAGISIVVFPEGTRSRDGRLLSFKKGGFLLAAKTRTRIVPVTIVGSAKLLPAGAWRLRPGAIDVFVDKPIVTETYPIGKLRALMDQVRQTIAAHLDQTAKHQPSANGDVEATAGSRTLEEQIA